jgi:hypothetical protein
MRLGIHFIVNFNYSSGLSNLLSGNMVTPILQRTQSLQEQKPELGLERYFRSKIEEIEMRLNEKKQNLRRLEAQRNEKN